MKRLSLLVLAMVLLCGCASADSPRSDTASPTPTGSLAGSTSDLTVEAGLILNNNTVQPVLRAPVWLVSGDVVTMADAGGYQYTGVQGQGEDRLFFFTQDMMKHVGGESGTLSASFYKTFEQFEDGIVAITETDFDGIAVFRDLPVGNTYHVYMNTSRFNDGSGLIIWNKPVTIQDEYNRLLLDQSDASWISE